MIILFICITVNSVLVAGSSLSDKVHQSPTDIYRKEGEKAKIKCLHSIDNFDQILWWQYIYIYLVADDMKMTTFRGGESTVTPPTTYTTQLYLTNMGVEGGSSPGDKVKQTPADIYEKPGGEAKIKWQYIYIHLVADDMKMTTFRGGE
ncbi:hypothetical protein INR49_028306, partial [Caranx melampygus]